MDSNTFAITIGRQRGRGGRAVGERIARRLGVRFCDRQLINLAAEQSGLCSELFERADEKRSRGLFSALIGYLRAPFAGDDAVAGNVLSGETLFKIQSDVIRELASRESCVFVGRCADYVLRDHPRRLDVFVSASRAARCERLCRLHGIAPAEAEAMMDREDARRAAYYDYYNSRGRWGRAATYHLCIDSSVLGIEGTADCVLGFAARKLGLTIE